MPVKRPSVLLLRRRGQATIEYVLMLATVVVVLSAFLTAFHTHIVRFLFIFIGQLLAS
ncbi:class III signal peptide-containing protein [Candidatus Avelusimicrobium sp.]|uniref:class III signal peptide-containing protein n=1 Tax=Candidatus Avelusimicrobium sp. TaxID=3048833 RepID=UPI003D7C4D19